MQGLMGKGGISVQLMSVPGKGHAMMGPSQKVSRG